MDTDEVIRKTLAKPLSSYRYKTFTQGATMIYDHTQLQSAHALGAEIQFNDPDYGWVNLRAPLWNADCEYRIKPDLETLLREAEEFN